MSRGLEVTGAAPFVGSHDILWITFDALRFDVAQGEITGSGTPFLSATLPGGRWQERHTPGNFTFPAHQAFFAGFLPTPVTPGRHARLFALEFAGSETTGTETCVLQGADIVDGLRRLGYRSVCIGGVGFFNPQNEIGKVLPGLFDTAHWRPDLGVTEPDSTRRQVETAIQEIDATPPEQPLFLFINVSATHQPNYFYLPGCTEDCRESQAAAIRYVDGCLPPLFEALRRRRPLLSVLCSDHGTAYGDDGYVGHRLSHPCVWTVPFSAFTLGKIPS